MNNLIEINCECCGKKYHLTKKQRYDLEREGFIVYCKKCADKIGLISWKALKEGIKIYKM